MAGERRTVAVIGSGVAGLTAAYILQQRHDVTLFEADDRLGGHAHTHDVEDAGRMLAVDSGFIVHNAQTYPSLVRLFRELGVRTRDTEMSMSVRCRQCGIEYAGARKLQGLFADPATGSSPRYLALLAQVPLFHRRARALLAGDEPDTVTLGEFLARYRFSRYFVQHFVVPLVSAVWSCGPGIAEHYPARYLFQFLANHGMLSVGGSPTWRTVAGGSRTYVELIAKQLTSVETGNPVSAVTRHPDGVTITDSAGESRGFHAVVVATHPDQALRLLTDATPAEQRLLGAIEYSRNTAILHTDDRLLPSRPGARASWNHLLDSCSPGGGGPRISYDLNRLQGLDARRQYIVTLNDAGGIDPERVIARMIYHHPVYTPASVAARRELPRLSDHRTAYAGAYHGWGFHEDGCRSGVQAAAALGVTW